MRWILLFCLLVCSPALLAWGKTGHRVAAEIATYYLTPEAKQGIQAILGPESLAEASTWADFMRSDPDEFWQKTSPPWHYVTVPEGKRYRDLKPPPEGDAITALRHFSGMLHDPRSSTEDRKTALRFIVHLIGDLHQPLHAGNGIDRGGNEFQVFYFGRGTNLHRVWDSGLIDGEQLSYTEMSRRLQAKITPEQVREWSDPDPLVWVGESVALRDRIYPENTRLGYEYGYRWLPEIRRRLQQAGVRMAVHLNGLFRSPPSSG